MKLAHKLILGMLMPAIVIGLVGMYVLNIWQDSMRTVINDTSAAYVSAIMAEIDRSMQSRIVGWKAYASGQDIQDYLIDANRAIIDLGDPQSLIDSRDADWRAAAAAGKTTPFMNRLLQHRMSRALRGLRDRLNQGFGQSIYPEIFITDRYGANVAQTNLTPEYRQSDESWWQLAMADGIYIGNVAFNKRAERYAIDVAFRIDDEEANPLGVMKVVISLAEVDSIIDQRSKDQRLVNRFNFILFSPDHRIIHTSMRDSDIHGDGASYFVGVEIPPGAIVVNAERTQQETGEELLSTYAISQPHGNLPGLGWILLNEYDAKDIYQPIYRLQRKFSLIALATALLAIIIGGAIAYSMSRRVNRLVKATRQFGEGRYVHPVDEKGTDELAILAKSFNKAGRLVLKEFSKRKHTEDELRKSRDMAEQANRAKSAFLANMSHELRTPMNAIIGYSEMLQEEAADSGQQEFIPDLEKINAAGKHLLSLINDILDLSKIEAGRMDLYLERFDLKAMLTDVISTVSPLIEKNRNTLEVDFADDLGTMRADLTKLRQALFNLLSNAAKFTSDGTVSLLVRRNSESGDDWITVTVRDTGIGIAPDKINHLFQEFTQADDSTTRNYGGTGLGLAITRRFCQMMGGNIWAESQPGQGSTFTIRLPAEVNALEVARAATKESTQSTDATPLTVKVSPDAQTILVIDDDESTCDMLRRTLEKAGYAVVVATSAETGLRQAHASRPDAITLDVMMPGMDGWSLLSTLKADPELMHIPVIMLTMIDDKGMGYSLGAAEYLTKPVDRSRLLPLLEKYTHHESADQVLLVDDNPEDRAMLCRMLESEGWAVTAAENGKMAIEAVTQAPPSVIMLDLMMPVMDGFEFLHKLRTVEAWQQIPVVVLTAKELDERELAELTLHAESVIRKAEMTPESILEHIRRAIETAG
ncbi:MAG: response regulator [Gammaproteobacteria bacterium]|nr:response regulator [Gammaproteobacteria bacterium]